MVNLPPDWSAFIGLLCSNRVRFLVVGAHALAANGRPRATQDLDILVEPTPANARRLGLALAEFGFAALAAEAWQFAIPDRMAVLCREPLRIDILTHISRGTFAPASRRRRRLKLDTHLARFFGQSRC